MNQLIYNCWREGSTVYFRVYAMPEVLRGKMKGKEVFIATNGMAVGSSTHVELGVEYDRRPGSSKSIEFVALLGSKIGDTVPAFRNCATAQEAAAFVQRVHAALAEFAANYKLPAAPVVDADAITLTFTNNN